MVEKVNHPSHYSQGGMEVIDVINAFTQECTGAESFYVGNIIKYVCRFKKKNGVEDLRKANWYLNELILKEELHERESQNGETIKCKDSNN
jgi:methyl coenzyme M reductase subunit C-like uncharacterized protein (methanogenesis marker protein 7)